MSAPELTRDELSMIDEMLMDHIDCLATMVDALGPAGHERAVEEMAEMLAIRAKLDELLAG